MSVEQAKQFLEEVRKDERLKALLADISIDDLKRALEEIELTEVSGGRGGGIWNW